MLAVTKRPDALKLFRFTGWRVPSIHINTFTRCLVTSPLRPRERIIILVIDNRDVTLGERNLLFHEADFSAMSSASVGWAGSRRFTHAPRSAARKISFSTW